MIPARRHPSSPESSRPARSPEGNDERIDDHTVRITVGGPGFGALRLNDFTDKYAKIIFADPALGLTPPYDLAGPDRGRVPVREAPAIGQV
jgi:NADPH-dependent ferric siderophore reductase